MKAIRDLIDGWPSAEVFADDIGLKWRSHGRVMKHRGRIPKQRWPDVVRAAHARGKTWVTEEWLQEAHEAERGAAQ